MFKTKLLFLTVMWICFIIASTVTCFYLVIESILDFTKYNTVTKIDVINQRQVPFPAISFCTSLINNKTIKRLRFDRNDKMKIF